VNLYNIKLLQDTFPDYPIGYSDHTIGTEVSCAAVALGASLIEKHLTLDRTKIGMDNQMATEPDDMAKLVALCRSVHSALGSYNRIVSDDELSYRLKMRRSLVYTRDLAANSVVTADDIYAKRPGTGICPERIKEFIGKRLICDVIADNIVTDDDFNKQI
jgi:N-acetylneuraminate synthase